MKLHQNLIGLFLLATVTCVQAAPDNATGLDDLVNKVSAGNSKEAAQSEAAGDLLLQAMSLLGVAYRFGGSTPTSGLDCSGFIQYIFKKSLKINMPRTAAEMARTGRSVSRDELAPGDLVFFNTRGFANSHVGLYMGNGKFIHSPRTGKSVEVVNLGSDYWSKRYNGARRVNKSTYGVADATPAPTRKTVEIKPTPATDTAPAKPAAKPKPTERSTAAASNQRSQQPAASSKGKSKPAAKANEEKASKNSKSTKKAEQEKADSSKRSKKSSTKADEEKKSSTSKKSASAKEKTSTSKGDSTAKKTPSTKKKSN